MANVRPYNPSVRVGNWFEDCQLEEDTIKNFLEKRERGELLSQKVGSLNKSVASSSQADGSAGLSTCSGGFLHFGDSIQLRNVGSDENLVKLGRAQSRPPAVLCVSIGESVLNEQNGGLPDPSPASASQSCSPTARSVLVVKSIDGSKDGQRVVYDQPFQLVTHDSLGSPMYLSSDRIKFGDTPRKHGKQAVQFTADSSSLTYWRVEYFNPQMRLEFEGSPVPVNERLILKHVRTNQALAVEDKYVIRGLLGTEFDVSTCTYLNDHKAEMDVNQWEFMANISAGAGSAAEQQ